jgi:hypothetical protein
LLWLGCEVTCIDRTAAKALASHGPHRKLNLASKLNEGLLSCNRLHLR